MAQKGYIKNSLTKDLGAPEMANMFQGIFGASGIMSLYENLACVKVDNNTVRMSAGAYNLSGHLLGIAKGTTEDLTIDSGTSGQNRNDLIVAEFVRNGGGLGVDTLHFTVVKGTSTSGTATDPALTQQDINAAGVTRQEALYRVKVAGTEITAVEKVAGAVSNLNLVQSNIDSHEALKSPHGVAPVELWTGSHITNDAPITLSESFKNFHFVIVVFALSANDNGWISNQLFSDLVGFSTLQATYYGSETIVFNFPSGTTLLPTAGLSSTRRLRKVYGLLRK